MVEIRQGNILEATEEVICHQTNCVSSDSAGLAGQIFTKWPETNVYKSRNNFSVPGEVIYSPLPKHKFPQIIAHMMAQFKPGKSRIRRQREQIDSPKKRLSYFKKCLKFLSKRHAFCSNSFAFPWKIGCGLAGGNWDEYMDLILEFSDANNEVVIYKLEEG